MIIIINSTYHKHFADRADIVDINVDEHLKRSTFKNRQYKPFKQHSHDCSYTCA